MAHDDMHVVMYKILSYLYSCMKSGERPILEHYSHDGDVLCIPYPYWASIIDEMQRKGYVSGFTVTRTWGGDVIVIPNDPKVTMDGVEFLQENARMRKALEFLKETKSALPFI